MSRLTVRGATSQRDIDRLFELSNDNQFGRSEAYYKLQHYEDLEEHLEELFGGKMPLDEVVENLNRVVQNGEEKLDYARILTNAEAKKWDKWKDLEEQGRLIELPCENVYRIMDYGSPDHAFIDSIPIETMPIYDLKHIDNGNIFFSYQRRSRSKAGRNGGGRNE